MRFVREDEMSDEQRKARDVVQTLVRKQQVSVQNLGRYKPRKVAQLVEKQLGVRFTLYGDHVRAWQFYNVRPPEHDKHPEQTDERYCIFDDPHKDYLYTDAWVKKLVKDLANAEKFAEVTGHFPVSLPESGG